MLNKKQQQKLNKMVRKYKRGMFLRHTRDIQLVNAWSKRYRIAMEQQLQRQEKR